MQVGVGKENVTCGIVGGQANIDFSISNSPEFFEILSNSLYKDPLYAMIREVLCNAWDAHIASNIDKPISVSIKNNCLIIRDFGSGIPHDKIGEIYGVYGSSTKVQDNSQTGGFGLGCKSPFAYTDHFEVTSYNGGKKTTYALIKASATADGRPTIKPILQFNTNETGLEVTIPIKPGTEDSVITNINKVAYLGDIRVCYDSSGKEVAMIGIKPEHKFMLSYHNNYLSTRYYQVPFYVRYGNVIYPLEKQKAFEEEYDELEQYIKEISITSNAAFILNAPANSLSVAPSRDNLHYSQKTNASIKGYLRVLNVLIEDKEGLVNTYYNQILKEASNDENFWSLFKNQIPSKYCEDKLSLNKITSFEDLTYLAAVQKIKDHDHHFNFLKLLKKKSKDKSCKFRKEITEFFKVNDKEYKSHPNYIGYNTFCSLTNNWLFNVYLKKIKKIFLRNELSIDKFKFLCSRISLEKTYTVNNVKKAPVDIVPQLISLLEKKVVVCYKTTNTVFKSDQLDCSCLVYPTTIEKEKNKVINVLTKFGYKVIDLWEDTKPLKEKTVTTTVKRTKRINKEYKVTEIIRDTNDIFRKYSDIPENSEEITEKPEFVFYYEKTLQDTLDYCPEPLLCSFINKFGDKGVVASSRSEAFKLAKKYDIPFWKFYLLNKASNFFKNHTKEAIVGLFYEDNYYSMLCKCFFKKDIYSYKYNSKEHKIRRALENISALLQYDEFCKRLGVSNVSKYVSYSKEALLYADLLKRFEPDNKYLNKYLRLRSEIKTDSLIPKEIKKIYKKLYKLNIGINFASFIDLHSICSMLHNKTEKRYPCEFVRKEEINNIFDKLFYLIKVLQ